MAQQNMTNLEVTQTLLNIVNSVFHIIESILSQEELPDFYEERLEDISQIMTFIFDVQYQTGASPSELTRCR